MTWEWLGPATVTAVVAIVGNYLTWRAGRDTREHAEHVAEVTAAAALKREREARRAAAYLDVLTTVIRITGSFLHRTSPTVVEGEGPEFPDSDELAALAAKAGLYGSDLLRDHFTAWAMRLQDLMDAYALPLGREAPYTRSLEEIKALNEARDALSKASGHLTKQMNSELATLPYVQSARNVEE